MWGPYCGAHFQTPHTYIFFIVWIALEIVGLAIANRTNLGFASFKFIVERQRSKR